MSCDPTTRIAVVVPFFQRQSGVLAVCLRSVIEQQLPFGTVLDIFVVNDSSPVPPQADLVDLPTVSAVSIHVISQENAGPAKARNTALDVLKEDTQFVAFIDSDDVWAPDHLCEALHALGADGDLYFCDSEVEPGKFEFEQIPLMAGAATLSCFDAVAGCRDVFAFRNQDAPLIFVKHYLAHTSTVVYRYSLMQKLRFEPGLRYGGEDHLMWVQIACRSRVVRFSTTARSQRGEGVNIYRDSLSRISSKNIRREACRVRAFAIMADLPELYPLGVKAAREQLDTTLGELAAILLRPAGIKAALEPAARQALRIYLNGFWVRLPGLWASSLMSKLLLAFRSPKQHAGMDVSPRISGTD